jgi:uncharacterized membrane protein YeaQ/YmgE (transglycosylase-associated protein family)
MSLLIIVFAMILVGLLLGYLAGIIWKDNRPLGVRGDYIAAVITTVAVGLLDWFVIPAMGFSDTIRNLGLIFEPALAGLLVLWLIRIAKR